ncbi:MAG: polysaccharide deacetylase family protein [Oscillospiraceae bacterium]|nr:polysaccharide deacetylase family protein [Oscillospiraceae bacterium]
MKIAGRLPALLLGALLLGAPLPAAAGAIGYGQGTQTDADGIPLGALDFDAQYRKYGAYATTPDRSRIILTFDQGYENGYTDDILDVLAEKHVTAIFFLTGDYAQKETELVRRMIADGHMLGNHGMTHASVPHLTPDQAHAELMDLHDLVIRKYGYTMQYFRCPCGEYSEEALQTARSLGYRAIFWSGAHVDWLTDKQPDPQQALAKLTAQAHGGEILLLHSVSSTNAQILGELIDRLRDMGYTL